MSWLSAFGSISLAFFILMMAYRRWRNHYYTEDVRVLLMRVDRQEDTWVIKLRLQKESAFERVVKNPFSRHAWGALMFVMNSRIAQLACGILGGYFLDPRVRQAYVNGGLAAAWRTSGKYFLLPVRYTRDIIPLARQIGAEQDRILWACGYPGIVELRMWAVGIVCEGAEGTCIRLILATPQEWRKLAMQSEHVVRLEIARGATPVSEKPEVPGALVAAARALVKEFEADRKSIPSGDLVGHEVKVPILLPTLKERPVMVSPNSGDNTEYVITDEDYQLLSERGAQGDVEFSLK